MSEESVIPKTQAEQAKRLNALLDELQKRGLDGFLVPRADEHQGEYVPPRAQRLAWLTGFTGSAGLAIVYRKQQDNQSVIFVDGRYTLQVRAQVDTELFDPQDLIEAPPRKWLSENLHKGAKIGFDPWLHTLNSIETLQKACHKAGAELVPCEENSLDAAWHDQPTPPLAPVIPHPLEYAGEESSKKRERIGQTLAKDNIDAAVITLPDSIAWLLNVRGGDVERSPLPLSFALIHADGHVNLFLDPRKSSPELSEHLGNGVSLQAPDQLGPTLDQLGKAGKTVQIDTATAAVWLHDRLKTADANIIRADDPCLLPKACKNDVELAGTRAAHERDGAAVSRFLHWLEQNGSSGTVDELSAEAQLQAFRAETGVLKDLSFDTISGSAANGAIVHYRVTAETNKPLQAGTLYLVDSGGQYLDGTTDVTRTIAIGTPTAEHKDRFTRVLKGHIALAKARFPKGTSGSQLDILARQALWQVGLDYDHGTGHGVGSYLCVHEGPQRISKVANNVALQPGMIISNEPGYYKTDEYGIRIENLVAVTEPEEISGGERAMMGFETLTFAPIDLNLIESSLLTQEEIAWLNDYHAQVRQKISPQLDETTNTWLKQATRAI